MIEIDSLWSAAVITHPHVMEVNCRQEKDICCMIICSVRHLNTEIITCSSWTL